MENQEDMLSLYTLIVTMQLKQLKRLAFFINIIIFFNTFLLSILWVIFFCASFVMHRQIIFLSSFAQNFFKVNNFFVSCEFLFRNFRHYFLVNFEKRQLFTFFFGQHNFWFNFFQKHFLIFSSTGTKFLPVNLSK